MKIIKDMEHRPSPWEKDKRMRPDAMKYKSWITNNKLKK